jgi:RNA recognition motif-containing protein
LSNECPCDAGFVEIGRRKLFRLSRLVGRYVSPFLFGRESEITGRVFVGTGECVLGRKLYCGNLSYNVTSSDLEELFSQFGSVKSAQVITDRDTGRSKGFGFVEMSNDAEAQAAIDGLNEKDHDGRPLTVNEARPRENRGGGGGGGGRGYGSRGGDGGRRY